MDQLYYPQLVRTGSRTQPVWHFLLLDAVCRHDGSRRHFDFASCHRLDNCAYCLSSSNANHEFLVGYTFGSADPRTVFTSLPYPNHDKEVGVSWLDDCLPLRTACLELYLARLLVLAL